jgi:predicted metalloprotease with PDZ domain
VNYLFRRLASTLALAALAGTAITGADVANRYRFTFPEPQHRWVQVEATFPEVGAAPLELRMSRASPGRYALHDFSKNAYDVHAFGADGREIATTRPDPYGWTVAGHGGLVTVKYKVFGDYIDGTYLAVDETHAHINMPAVIMWARGLDDRAATIGFEPPSGARWLAATQLYPGSTPFEFTAPNLQYLMDSPVEIGPLAIRQFTTGGRTFRFAVHETSAPAELDAFVRDVEKIVREEGEIFGEYPTYEPGHYTFLADYLPYAAGDAMEHRNSTVMTSTGAIQSDRVELLETVAHEFFHGWNVERIRPQSLEPFDFERANISSELWMAEGFTQYYGQLVLGRTGIVSQQRTIASMAGFVASVESNAARSVRSAEEMSQMAAFTDGGATMDKTNWYTTFISYYEYGGAIALALDLSLRDRSDGRVTLDDYMRAMWRVHGKPGGARPGYVDRPYTSADAEMRLAEVSGDAAFARDFFTRFVRGREIADYKALFARAGVVLRRRNPGRAWWGEMALARNGAVRVASAPAIGTPAYAAGLDIDDQIVELDGTRVVTPEDVAALIRRRRPGDVITVGFVDRTGTAKTARVTLAEDPRIDVIPRETAGELLSPDERRFRESWLN